MPENIEHMEELIVKEIGLENFEKVLNDKLQFFRGIVERDGCITLIYEDLFDEESQKSEDKHQKFLNQWKSKLKYIVNNSNVRDLILSKVQNKDGTYNHFKFGLSKLANKQKDNVVYSEAPFSCYIFILSIFNSFHQQYGDFTSVKFLLWDKPNSQPKAYTSILPSFMKICTSKNSYNRLYFVEFEGLKQSEVNENRQFYSGSVQPIAKINKDVQSSLSN